MMKKIIKLVFFLSVLAQYTSCATEYFVNASTGNDNNDGLTANTPFLTFSKGFATAVAGDVINLYSGTYSYSGTITFSKSNITLRGVFSSPSTRPVFDFSSMVVADASAGIQLKGSNWYIYGIVIKGAGDNGLLVNGGKYNTIEFCDFLENRDSGVQLKSGASFNKFINCDSYYNVDPAQGNADGFADKLDQAGFNSFRGCRAWQNSDDGWDGLIKDQTYTPTDTIINCWCYKNGYLKDGSVSAGNGNGFKLGGNSLIHRNIVMNCLSALNLSKGFDQNNGSGAATLYNCTAYGNLNSGNGNYSFPLALASGETLTLTNCLSHGGSKYGTLQSSAIQTTNSWMSPFSVSDEDFVSLDHTQMLLPRKADGSLPDITFMHLADGSDMIDAGSYVGLPYTGNSPDLGCFERPGIVGVNDVKFQEGLRAYPNPVSHTLNIETPEANTTLRLFNAQGVIVEEESFADGLSLHKIELSHLKHGIYKLDMEISGKHFYQSIVKSE